MIVVLDAKDYAAGGVTLWCSSMVLKDVVEQENYGLFVPWIFRSISGLFVSWTFLTIHAQNCLLLLLSPKTDTHLTVSWRVEGRVDLGTAAKARCPYGTLYITVDVAINTQPSTAAFYPGHRSWGATAVDHCDTVVYKEADIS